MKSETLLSVLPLLEDGEVGQVDPPVRIEIKTGAPGAGWRDGSCQAGPKGRMIHKPDDAIFVAVAGGHGKPESTGEFETTARQISCIRLAD